MIEYYIHKYFFNASHGNSPDIEKAHHHTFQVVLYISNNKGKMELFNDMDKDVRDYLKRFEGAFLNNMPEFKGGSCTLEDMGEVFYAKLLRRLEKRGFRLYQLEISDNPLCVYIVSNRIMLSTRSDKESMESIENILNRKKRLLEMLHKRDG